MLVKLDIEMHKKETGLFFYTIQKNELEVGHKFKCKMRNHKTPRGKYRGKRCLTLVLHGYFVTSVMFDSLQPMDCSPPGSSVHGILLARILQWVAMSSSRISS